VKQANAGSSPLMHRYLGVVSAAAVASACWLGFVYSQEKVLARRYGVVGRQLTEMKRRSARIDALTQSLGELQATTVETIETEPLVEFLEEAADKRRVRLTNISPRPPVESRRKVLNRLRVTTEQVTWVQVAEARLEDLVYFLHEIETERQPFFIKELTNLSPNEGKGDNWRVRVVLSRVDVRQDIGGEAAP